MFSWPNRKYDKVSSSEKGWTDLHKKPCQRAVFNDVLQSHNLKEINVLLLSQIFDPVLNLKEKVEFFSPRKVQRKRMAELWAFIKCYQCNYLNCLRR